MRFHVTLSNAFTTTCRVPNCRYLIWKLVSFLQHPEAWGTSSWGWISFCLLIFVFADWSSKEMLLLSTSLLKHLWPLLSEADQPDTKQPHQVKYDYWQTKFPFSRFCSMYTTSSGSDINVLCSIFLSYLRQLVSMHKKAVISWSSTIWSCPLAGESCSLVFPRVLICIVALFQIWWLSSTYDV